MKLEDAQAIVAFVVREAPSPVSVFVADTHGELVAAATMDGAAPDTRLNAQRQDWLAAVADLERAQKRWPEAVEHFVTLRVPLDHFGEAFEHRGGKATLMLSD